MWLASDGAGSASPGAAAAGPGEKVLDRTIGAELRAGRTGSARPRLEGALARDPDDLAALSDLAVSYAIEARLGAARTLFEEVLARTGGRSGQAALLNLGELYAAEGYLDAAAAHLASARAADPSRPEPLYALALLADARGDVGTRGRALSEALAADPGGVARSALCFLAPEARLHLEALVLAQQGDETQAQARFRELAEGRFPFLARAALRHLAAGSGGGE